MTTAELIRTASEAEAALVVRAKLLSDDEWLRRAVVAIHRYQTQQEQRTQNTIEHNGVGFNGVDATILSSFAEQIQRGSRLSAKQLGIARSRMLKYARQLVNIARQS